MTNVDLEISYKILNATFFTLPWPPSLNNYYKKWRNRIVVSEEGREYRGAVQAAVFEQIPNIRFNTGDRIAAYVVAYPCRKGICDLDNRWKATLDTLQHAGVYPDDGQVDTLHMDRGDIIKGGKLEIWLGLAEPKTEQTDE